MPLQPPVPGVARRQQKSDSAVVRQAAIMHRA
jgi:hypothetical protein